MNIKRSALLLLIILTGLYSCKNNDEVFAPKVSSFINVVNASTDTLNFYLNGTRQNNTSNLSPGGQSFYLTVPAGLQNYQFKKFEENEKSLVVTPVVLFSTPLTLKDSSNYSLYVWGETAAQTLFTPDPLFIDTVVTNTQVRFVNVSPDPAASTLDVYIDSASYKSQAFKSSSAFLHFGAGQKEVKVYLSGSATPKIDTNIVFQEGDIYTLYSKGLINGKGNAAFNVGVVLNH